MGVRGQGRSQQWLQEPLGKLVFWNENGMGSSHLTKGLPFLILTEAPYRLTAALATGPGPRSWVVTLTRSRVRR